jgi:hypothetical protein
MALADPNGELALKLLEIFELPAKNCAGYTLHACPDQPIKMVATYFVTDSQLVDVTRVLSEAGRKAA